MTGDQPLVYTWKKYTGSVADTYASNASSYLTSITAGKYDLVVASGSCSATFTYTVGEPSTRIFFLKLYYLHIKLTKFIAAINITTTTVAPTCAASGSITVNVTGGMPGYNVTLKNSSGDSMLVPGGFIGSLPQDFYTVVVFDSHLCKATSEVALIQPCMPFKYLD